MSSTTEKLFIGGWLVLAGTACVGMVTEAYCNFKNNRRQQKLCDLQAKALEYTNKAYDELEKEKK